MIRNLFYVWAVLLAMTGICAEAQTVETSFVEDGGSGPYKAVRVHEAQLDDFTLYRPADLTAAVRGEGHPLPVALFANGGCRLTTATYENFLTEIASQGYLVVCLGRYEHAGERSGHDVTTNALRRSSAQSLLETLDVLEWLAADPASEYYKNIDPDQACCMGQSCGGLQSIIIGTSGDARIRTMLVIDSGVTRMGDAEGTQLLEAGKQILSLIETPCLYINGGQEDMAYANGLDDYNRISHVPVVHASYPAGHKGTYTEYHGGEYSKMVRAWLGYIFKGDHHYGRVFATADESAFPGWTILSKGFTQ